MARYSIDGQILTDMADHIRTIKDLSYETLDFTDSQSTLILGRTRELIKPLTPGKKFKISISCSSSDFGDSSTLNISENDVNGASIYNYGPIYNNQITEIVFTTTASVSSIYCSARTPFFNTTLKLTIESCDEEGNVNCYFTPQEMADVMPELASSSGKNIILTGNQSHGFSGSLAQEYISMFPDKVTTNNITTATYMFDGYQGTTIPFEINMKPKDSSTKYHSCTYMFANTPYLTELPKVNNLVPEALQCMFYGAYRLREIPEEWVQNLDLSYMSTLTSSYSGNCQNVFNYCYSLRKIPMSLLKGANPVASYTYSYLYGGFQNCYALDDLRGIPIVNATTVHSSNMFSTSFSRGYRLNGITFETPNGSPIVAPWKGQSITLSTYIGYGQNDNYITDYNSGITIDKKVTDDASYQALKNDPDWYTLDARYSRYNKTSAIETIRSLPDCSATVGSSSNTIKFKGDSGSLTDGGAINTMSESDIAIAAAKGWTVTYA